MLRLKSIFQLGHLSGFYKHALGKKRKKKNRLV